MKKKNFQVVGIDYGTTTTEAAILDETAQPKVISDVHGDPKIPSKVYFGPRLKEVLVGRAAVGMEFVEPGRTVVEAKRDIGTGKTYFSDNGVDVTPELSATETFKHVRTSLIQYSGDDRAGSEAVIAVPANYLDNQRQAIKKAAEGAGIDVLQLINEPTAAGLAHGVNEKQGDRLVGFPDFGGGTFDFSVMKYSGEQVDVLASHGDARLGGRDIENALLAKVAERFKAEHKIEISPKKNPVDYLALRTECVRVKELLSSKQEVKLIGRFDGKQIVWDVTREEFKRIVASLMERARKVILDGLDAAKISARDVDQVVPVGGSSRVVAYREMIAEVFGNDKIVGGSVCPDLAVAEGAAIKAGQIVWKAGDSLVTDKLEAIPAYAINATDVTPCSLGVNVQDRVSTGQYCSVILPKNSPIPCKISRMYSSTSPTQETFLVLVLQGEQGQRVQDCLVVAQKQLVLPRRSPDQKSLEVTMSYDESALVKVLVHDLVSDKTYDITVQHNRKSS
jgi:molecular chaperone DnaK